MAGQSITFGVTEIRKGDVLEIHAGLWLEVKEAIDYPPDKGKRQITFVDGRETVYCKRRSVTGLQQNNVSN